MKKPLLLSLSLLAAMSATAITAETLENFYSLNVSPDGRYIIGQGYGEVTIYDRETGTKQSYGDGEMVFYSVGNGNTVGNGILVGNMGGDPDAAYWKDGKWNRLPTENDLYMLLPQGITPDGSRICGSAARTHSGDYEGIMCVPVVWDQKEDGSYSDLIYLPYPSTEYFTNNAPQYVQPVCISDDGKTIVGQVTSNDGMMYLPIIFKQDDKGEWSYEWIGKELFNPDGIVLPEEPGDAPVGPDLRDYASVDQLEAYDARYAEWVASGWDGVAPELEDFMEEDQIQEYQKALEEFIPLAEEYNAKLEAYFTARQEILDSSPCYDMNIMYISPDGKKGLYSITNEEFDPMTWSSTTTSYGILYDLETGEHTILESQYPQTTPSGLLADGTILAHSVANMWGMTLEETLITPYILLPGADDYTPLYDYLVAKDPAFKDWADKNLVHTYEGYEMTDDGDWVTSYADVLTLGLPTANPDMSVLQISNSSVSWMEADYWYITYVFTDLASGIEDVALDSEALIITAMDGACIGLSGDADALEIYDLGGRLVFSTSAPSAVISTGLSSGAYIVKATAGANSTIQKVVL